MEICMPLLEERLADLFLPRVCRNLKLLCVCVCLCVIKVQYSYMSSSSVSLDSLDSLYRDKYLMQCILISRLTQVNIISLEFYLSRSSAVEIDCSKSKK